MRLISLLFTATLVAAPAWAQQGTASSPADQQSTSQPQPSGSQDLIGAQPATSQPPATGDQQTATGHEYNLPVSLDKIKGALEQSPTSRLTMVDNRPTFRIQILERQKIEELLATLNFKAGPVPAGGLYWNEVQRVMWPSVDNPLRQPYAAFNQGELLTILVENLVGKYLGGKAVNAVTKAARSHAEEAARDEVRQAVQQYCAAQPNGGTGIEICSMPLSAIR